MRKADFKPHGSADQRSVIRAWIATVLTSGGIERFADLHIDEIDARWSDRLTWMDGAIAALEMAVEICEENSEKARPAVGISLVGVGQRDEGSLDRLSVVLREMDVSPPSLYLFREGEEPWRSDSDFSEWPVAGELDESGRWEGFLRVWWDVAERCFQRSLFIVKNRALHSA